LRSASLVTAAIALVMAVTVTLPSTAQAATSHAYEPMPNFVGMDRSGVYSEMYSAKLYFKTTGPGADTSRWVRVVGELPAAGTMIHPLSTVILQVTTVSVALTAVRHVLKQTSAVHHVLATTHVVKKKEKKKQVIKFASVARTSVTRPTSTRHKVTHPRVENIHVGVATWYSYIPGQCATWYLPRGTRIYVEDLDNHKVISCVVTDQEAAHGDRAVDLSETQFAQLAPLGVGVVPVKVTW
jgi:beta-lactam-binding protein with PASTA domain